MESRSSRARLCALRGLSGAVRRSRPPAGRRSAGVRLWHWRTPRHGGRVQQKAPHKRLDETGRTFICAEHFGRLSTLGWTDVWRHDHPGITAYTWYSKLKGGARGNGFRLDHAFATPCLVPRITSCRYSHVERCDAHHYERRAVSGSLRPGCGLTLP
jgi:hypothetical protein